MSLTIQTMYSDLPWTFYAWSYAAHGYTLPWLVEVGAPACVNLWEHWMPTAAKP